MFEDMERYIHIDIFRQSLFFSSYRNYLNHHRFVVTVDFRFEWRVAAEQDNCRALTSPTKFFTNHLWSCSLFFLGGGRLWRSAASGQSRARDRHAFQRFTKLLAWFHSLLLMYCYSHKKVSASSHCTFIRTAMVL